MDEASSSCPSDEDEDDEDDEQDDDEDDEDTTPDCNGLVKSSTSVRCFLGWAVCASLPTEESFLFKSDPSARRKKRTNIKRYCFHKYHIYSEST